jgi:hypothetical protein
MDIAHFFTLRSVGMSTLSIEQMHYKTAIACSCSCTMYNDIYSILYIYMYIYTYRSALRVQYVTSSVIHGLDGIGGVMNGSNSA